MESVSVPDSGGVKNKMLLFVGIIVFVLIIVGILYAVVVFSKEEVSQEDSQQEVQLSWDSGNETDSDDETEPVTVDDSDSDDETESVTVDDSDSDDETEPVTVQGIFNPDQEFNFQYNTQDDYGSTYGLIRLDEKNTIMLIGSTHGDTRNDKYYIEYKWKNTENEKEVNITFTDVPVINMSLHHRVISGRDRYLGSVPQFDKCGAKCNIPGISTQTKDNWSIEMASGCPCNKPENKIAADKKSLKERQFWVDWIAVGTVDADTAEELFGYTGTLEKMNITTTPNMGSTNSQKYSIGDDTTLVVSRSKVSNVSGSDQTVYFAQQNDFQDDNKPVLLSCKIGKGFSEDHPWVPMRIGRSSFTANLEDDIDEPYVFNFISMSNGEQNQTEGELYDHGEYSKHWANTIDLPNNKRIVFGRHSNSKDEEYRINYLSGQDGGEQVFKEPPVVMFNIEKKSGHVHQDSDHYYEPGFFDKNIHGVLLDRYNRIDNTRYVYSFVAIGEKY